MDVTYKQNEMNAYKIAVQLEQALKKEKSDLASQWLQRLALIEQQIQTRKFRMAVVGEFNRGKSSFINVLLGKKILPEDVLAATATINRVTYGEKPKAYLIMKDGSKNREVPVEELASYVTKLTESSAAAAAQIKEAVVEYPTMLCYHDVDLIDTPGMNDADDMNAVTVNQLEDIDLAVVAINAQYPYSQTENRFVVKLLESKKVCQIIFVITHFDMVRGREQKKLMDFLHSRIRSYVFAELSGHYQTGDRIFQKYYDIFDNLRLYGVSSVDAMDALESNDMELYEKSGFLKLSKELPEVILSSKSINMMDNIVTLLEEIIGEYKKQLVESGEEWKNWKKTEDSLCKIFDIGLEELEELSDNVLNAKELVQTMEEQKQEAVGRLLNSLGTVKTMTASAVQEAMLPVMQQEFERINTYHQDRKRRVFETVCIQNWASSLSRTIAEAKEKISRYPRLVSRLRTESERLDSLLMNPCVTGNLDALDSPGSGTSMNETAFYWLDSPVQAVLQTGPNQSVLPGIRSIVSGSMEDCRDRIERGMRNEFGRRISQVRKEFDLFLKSLNECIIKEEKEGPENTELLSDLFELQSECDKLHRRIKLEKKE